MDNGNIGLGIHIRGVDIHLPKITGPTENHRLRIYVDEIPVPKIQFSLKLHRMWLFCQTTISCINEVDVQIFTSMRVS